MMDPGQSAVPDAGQDGEIVRHGVSDVLESLPSLPVPCRALPCSDVTRGDVPQPGIRSLVEA